MRRTYSQYDSRSHIFVVFEWVHKHHRVVEKLAMQSLVLAVIQGTLDVQIAYS